MYGQLLAGWHSLVAANRTAVTLSASHSLAAVTRQMLVGSHRLSAIDQPQKDVSALGVYLSGGTTNTDKNASIGGQISTEPFAFQSFIQKTTLPGVSVLRIGNSGLGTGVLRYEQTGDDYVFKWVPRGSAETFGRIVTGDGKYGILTAHGIGTGYAVVDVTFASLSAGVVEAEIEVSNVVPNLFADSTVAQAETGYYAHRCVYIKNEHETNTLSNLQLIAFKSGNTGSVVEVAADGAGAGNGITTAVATTPPDETGPMALTFTDTATLPSLTPGQVTAVWVRRYIYSGWYKDLNPDVHLFLLTGGF